MMLHSTTKRLSMPAMCASVVIVAMSLTQKDEPELYWMDETSPEGRTLACPMCIVDSILGDATGLPIHEHAFIEACSMDWFDSCVALNEWGPNLLATPITIIVEPFAK